MIGMTILAYVALVASLIVSVAVNALQFCRLKKSYREMKEMRNDREW